MSGAAAFRQGESEEASRRDFSLKPKEAADDSIASHRDKAKPSTGFRGRASGAKIPCARCTHSPFLITHSPLLITHYSLLITLNLFLVAPMAQIVFANATMIIARYMLYIFGDVIYLCA